MRDRLVTPTPDASLAAAFHPGKEAWKNEPGNRYTAEELREMDRNWDDPDHQP